MFFLVLVRMTAIDSSKPDREVMESVVAHEQIVCDPASNTGRAHTDERDEVFVYPPLYGQNDVLQPYDLPATGI